MEVNTIVERIQAIKAEMSTIEERVCDLSLTLEEIKSLDDEWDILDAELAMYDDMLNVWADPQFEEPPPSPPSPEKEEEEEIDYTNPPEWLVKKWDEERDSWTNWNAYSDATFDLADEV